QMVVNNTGSGQLVSYGNFAFSSVNLLNLANTSGVRILGGTLVVAGTYNGTTTFTVSNNTEIANGAALRITRTGALPFGTPATSGGGTMEYDGGSGSVLTVTGSLGHTGGTTVSSGTLQLASGATLGSGNIAVASSARLDFNQPTPANVAYSGTISGAGQLTKFGSGTFALTGNNSFTGGITAGDGVLSMAQLDVSRLITGSTPGTLAVAGNGTLDVSTANGVGGLAFRLGTASDLVTVASGNVQVGNGLLDFSDFTFTPVTGFDVGSYTLFSATNLFGTLGIGTTGSVGDKLGTLQVIGNTLQLAVTAVPEPSLTAVTSMAAAAGVLLLRRRRR
ncbi:MAG: autotransporter-associated beta strand repeat-containing protein, partial [Pirellulales bacterium]